MASLKQLEAAFSLTPEERKKFYLLANLAKTAFEAGEFVKAEEYSTELLNKAAQYKNDWNHGNAIHHGNLVLGRLVLRSGDVDKAKAYLIRAGETPGSPQLNSFGPNMTLAKELLEKGEREIVIQYFELCSRFWKKHKDRLDNWTIIVRDGGIPEFGANLDY
jgi:tetratricopeptide (TPR) repeat protein